MTTAKSELGWLVALGASAVLHTASVALVMAQLVRHSTSKAHEIEVPDIWRGAEIAVDTVTPESASAGSQPMTESSLPQAAHESDPADVPPVTPVNTHKSLSVEPRSAAPIKWSPPIAAAAEKVDPDEALRRRILNFQPAPSKQNTAQQAESSSEAPPTETGGGSSEFATEVRNLAKAFTRALPNAASADDRWQQSSLGKLEQGTVILQVDTRGAIVDTAFNREASPRFRELVRRTVLSLGAGQFALRATEVTAGKQEFEIEIELSQHTAGDVSGSSDRVTALGYEAPHPGTPGKGYFTLASGRHFEARVRIVN